MKNIHLIKIFDPEGINEMLKDKEVSELFDGGFRKLIEVRLRNGAVLSRHKAAEPITVFCVSGNGLFKAGADLGDELKLSTGTLLTLEAGIEHEVIAQPGLHLLITKFK
ncbi:MAG: hypothetical protein ABIP78_13405 [Pyrinomonadaceae bacterium]